jgi:hypothetical protein
MEKCQSLKGGFKRQFIYIYIKEKIKAKMGKKGRLDGDTYSIFSTVTCVSIIRKTLKNTK